MRNTTALVILLLFVMSAFSKSKCPYSSAQVNIDNGSPYLLRLHTQDEHTCKLHRVADIKPNTNKHFCLKHNYIMRVTTYYKGERAASAETDLWNDIRVVAKDSVFDVAFTHYRGEEQLVAPHKVHKVDWEHHEHDAKKATQDKDHHTESLLD